MAFITISNLKGIIKKSTADYSLKGDIYKIPIFFFNKYEEAELLSIKELLENPERYFEEVYKGFGRYTNNEKFIFQTNNGPAFHSVRQCDRLNSNYTNYIIPEQISQRGLDDEFREWFINNLELLNDRPDLFLMRLQIKWGVDISLKQIELQNSGTISISNNMTKEEFEDEIDKKLKEAGRLYYKSEKNKTIIRQFSKYAYKGFSDEPLSDNYTEYADEEIKEFLRDYELKIKRPVKNMLVDYYRVMLNPDLEFDDSLLEAIGFKPCSSCNS